MKITWQWSLLYWNQKVKVKTMCFKSGMLVEAQIRNWAFNKYSIHSIHSTKSAVINSNQLISQLMTSWSPDDHLLQEYLPADHGANMLTSASAAERKSCNLRSGSSVHLSVHMLMLNVPDTFSCIYVSRTSWISSKSIVCCKLDVNCW